ncbi:hypothetical protein, partial [Paraburkholderia sp. RL17-373-BIF-A]|uniref:hypothetical protein n=1 Tax=Paraburkholderia sp. RL17-373-BIF-A TaxID=3031629 RepID=UPI0038B86D9D
AVISAADLVDRVEIAKLRAQAEAELKQAKQDATAMRAAALEAAEHDIAVLRQQAYDHAVADAVQWICREQHIEKSIAAQLTMRWRKVMAEILEGLLGKTENTELLLRRVEREVGERLPHGRLTLYVEPAAVAAATRNFLEVPAILVVADAELSNGQARLDNGLVCVYFDERRYQAKLLQELARD